MIIKINEFELEISAAKDVYLGSIISRKIFKKWNKFEKSVKLRLEIIQNKAEKLIMESEEILLSNTNA